MLIYNTESVNINKIVDKNNTHIIKILIDENKKIIKYINGIQAILKDISKYIQKIQSDTIKLQIHLYFPEYAQKFHLTHDEPSSSKECNYIKYLYNLIVYEHSLKKSFNIIECNLNEFLLLLKNNNKDTYVNIFNEISTYSDFFNENFNYIKKQKEYTIEMLDSFFEKTYIHINSMSSLDKIIAKNIISKIIKKNISFFNLLLHTKYLQFLKLLMDDKDILFIQKLPYIQLIESSNYDHNNHIMKYLFHQYIQKEVCLYF
jgi:hypothetical protein